MNVKLRLTPLYRIHGRENDVNVVAQLQKGVYRGRIRGFMDTLVIVGSSQETGKLVMYFPTANVFAAFGSSSETVDLVLTSATLVEDLA